MIVVKLMAGLGNQMFQYAAGRTLAEKHQTDLYLDLSWFEGQKAAGDTSRVYELGYFNLPAIIAPKKIGRAVFMAESGAANLGVLTKIAKLSWGKLPQLNIVRQEGAGVNENFFKSSDDTLLIGWWQSPEYFAGISSLIRKDFRFNEFSNGSVKELAGKVKQTDSVSVHVRRGDFITNEEAKAFHGSTNLDFYKTAAKRIASKLKAPVFYVISDDIRWCQKNLELGGFSTVFVTNTRSAYEDMHLMSLCQHNIIANSSFSWLGAWLNNNDSKIVIAPRAWFQDKKSNSEIEIIPKEWIRI